MSKETAEMAGNIEDSEEINTVAPKQPEHGDQALTDYNVERFTIEASGEDYIKLAEINHRIIMNKKIKNSEKKKEIARIAMELLFLQVDSIVASGKTFMTPSEILDDFRKKIKG